MWTADGARPYALMLADVGGGRFAGQAQLATNAIAVEEGCDAYWSEPPTSEQLLTHFLVLLLITKGMPRMLAFDGESAHHAAALAPFLWHELQVCVVVSSIELPLVLQLSLNLSLNRSLNRSLDRNLHYRCAWSSRRSSCRSCCRTTWTT